MKAIHDTSNKPYNHCLSCPQFRHTCAGLPTRDMSLKEWCEYIRDVMDMAHLHNPYVAQEAGVSLKTIERIRATNVDSDFMRETARKVEIAVIGNVTKIQCYVEFEESDEVKKLKADIEYWRKENDRKAKIIDKYLD